VRILVLGSLGSGVAQFPRKHRAVLVNRMEKTAEPHRHARAQWHSGACQKLECFDGGFHGPTLVVLAIDEDRFVDTKA